MADDKPKLRLIAGGVGPDAASGGGLCAALPEGATCGDCLWFATCHPLGYARAGQRECDFFPSRFVRDQEVKP